MNMDKELFREFAEALRGAVKRRKNRRIQRAWDEDSFLDLVQDAVDPTPEEEPISVTTVTPSSRPKFDPDAFPKLKTRYGPDPAEQRKLLSRLSGEKALEFLKKSQSQSYAASAWFIANNPEEELPFHSWRTEPMDRLEQLKADGVPEFIPPRKSAVA